MKKNIICILAVIALVLFMLPVAAFAIPTITYVHNVSATDPNKTAYIDDLNAYIKSVSDKYIVRQIVGNSDDYKAQLAINAASGKMDDIIWFFGDPADISPYVAKNLFLDVKDYFGASKVNKYSDWSDDVWKMASYRGVPYVIPTEGAAAVWVCNSKLFNQFGLKYPKTFEDIINLAPTFHNNGIITLATGSSGGNPSHQHLAFIYMQYKGADKELADISTTYKISTDNLAKALDLIAGMRNADCFPSDTVSNGDWGANVALYNNGLAAIIPLYSWQMSALSNESMANSVIINIPAVKGGVVDTSKVQLVGNPAGLLISTASWKDDAKRTAIIDFIDWYLSDKQEQLRYQTLCQVPLKTMKVDYDATPVSILAKAVRFNKSKHGFLTHWYTIPNAGIWADFQKGLDQIWAGTMTTADFMKMIDASCAQNR